MKRIGLWLGVFPAAMLSTASAQLEAQAPESAPSEPEASIMAQAGAPTPTTEAGVPRLVRFNGVLSDSLGDVAGAASGGLVGLTFALYKEQNGGAPLWFEIQNVQVDAKGGYTVLLGASKSEGLPLELFASGEARWLEVQLVGDVSTESQGEAGEERRRGVSTSEPRILLVSVPYALKAAEAETLGGMPASAFVLAQGQSGSTTEKPEPSDVQPNLVAGTVGRIAKFTTADSVGNSIMFESGPNIGLGTTTPTARLSLGNEVTDNKLSLYDAPGDKYGFGIRSRQLLVYAGGGTGADITFGRFDGSSFTETMRITNRGNLNMSGILSLPATSASAGVIMLGGFRFAHAFGNENTFLGQDAGNFTMTGRNNTAVGRLALGSNTTGASNTAVGRGALLFNSTGGGNTAVGLSALRGNTTGGNNTAMGRGALERNTTGTGNTSVGQGALANNSSGGGNTAVGQLALERNTTGSGNTAMGQGALANNSSGSSNTAVGARVLTNNTTGAGNTAVGDHTLVRNTTGSANTAVGQNTLQNNSGGGANTAVGESALLTNTSGSDNTAVGRFTLTRNTRGFLNTAMGQGALANNTTGTQNTAVGPNALLGNTTGHGNIAIGSSSGSRTTGSDNIDIGNEGVVAESSTVRIGVTGLHTRTFIAGIFGATASGGAAVFVNPGGQLGTSPSWRGAKEAVEEIGEASQRLLRLRPVQFRYKPEYDDGSRLLQYGLIAEEVAEVFPELVLRGPSGEVETVRYHLLPALLLNELQGQQSQLAELRQALAARSAEKEAEIAALRQQLEELRTVLTEQRGPEAERVVNSRP